MFTADTSLCCFTHEVSRCVHVCISTLYRWPQNSSKISADRDVQHLHSFPSCFLSPVSLCFVFCPPICSFHLVNSTPFCLIFSHLILITPPLHFFPIPPFPFFSHLLSLSSFSSCFPLPFSLPPPVMCLPPLLSCPLYFLPFPSFLSSLAALPFLFSSLSFRYIPLLCFFPFIFLIPLVSVFLSSHILCCFPFKMTWCFFSSTPLYLYLCSVLPQLSLIIPSSTLCLNHCLLPLSFHFLCS